MSAASPSTPAGSNRVRVTWPRRIAVAVLIAVGVCEMLATMPGIDWSRAPGWLGGTVAIVGFLAFLLFFGLLSLVGNLAVGALLFALLWRGWGWPLWLAALAAAPFWIAFSSFIPKPW
jgi:hypothetical protein